MKYIVIPSSNRSGYFAQFLRHINAAMLPNWTAICAHEPTGDLETVRNMAASSGFECFTNIAVLGPCANTWRAIQLAAMRDDCEAILQVDDDCLLSPDALSLCDWYLRLPHQPDDVGICLMNSASANTHPNAVTRALTHQGHVGQGYCYTRQQFEAFVRPNFWVRSERFASNSYDWALGQIAQELGFKFARPVLSRSKHIGLVGANGAAAGVHVAAFPAVVAASLDKNPNKFTLIP